MQAFVVSANNFVHKKKIEILCLFSLLAVHILDIFFHKSTE